MQGASYECTPLRADLAHLVRLTVVRSAADGSAADRSVGPRRFDSEERALVLVGQDIEERGKIRQRPSYHSITLIRAYVIDSPSSVSTWCQTRAGTCSMSPTVIWNS